MKTIVLIRNLSLNTFAIAEWWQADSAPYLFVYMDWLIKTFYSTVFVKVREPEMHTKSISAQETIHN